MRMFYKKPLIREDVCRKDRIGFPLTRVSLDDFDARAIIEDKVGNYLRIKGNCG